METLARKWIPDQLRRTIKRVLHRRYINAFWSKTDNWGDALNPILIEMICGRAVRFTSDEAMPKYLVIGSVLALADSQSEVWGAGFMKADESINGSPLAVHAVRGPLSAKMLEDQGVPAPKVYGDPALLLPRYYQASEEKRFRVGIVPHYCDKGHPWVEQFRDHSDVLILDVEGDCFEFVDGINACEIVVSSSLHGLICADAYGVESIWIELSDLVHGKGFKFRDYYMGIGWEVPEPVRIQTCPSLSRLVSQHIDRRRPISTEALLRSCPFPLLSPSQ